MVTPEKPRDRMRLNLELRDISVRDNNVMNALAKLRGMSKWQIVKEACEEYVKNHEGDIINLMKQRGSLPSARAIVESQSQ